MSREQRDLFGPTKPTAPFQPHSDTSRAAAKAIEPKLSRLERQVAALLERTPPGLTDNQMQSGLAMNGNTQRPRRIRLVELGYVKDTGERRATGSGRPATVWGWTGKEIE